MSHSSDFLGGDVELDVVCELKSMTANYVTKGEHVWDEEASVN